MRKMSLRPCSVNDAKLGYFTLLFCRVLQAFKCSKIYKPREQNLLFGCVLVAIFVLVCLSPVWTPYFTRADSNASDIVLGEVTYLVNSLVVSESLLSPAHPRIWKKKTQQHLVFLNSTCESVYLQGCHAYKQCSESYFCCRYLNPHI